LTRCDQSARPSVNGWTPSQIYSGDCVFWQSHFFLLGNTISETISRGVFMPSRQGWRTGLPVHRGGICGLEVNQKQIVALAFLSLTQSTSAQNNIPTYKVESKSALVWDENSLESTASSIRDPLSGNEIHRLSYDGIEVSSRVGYERVSPSKEDRLINYTTTVANNTDSDATVQYGGVSVDGNMALPLRVAADSKGLSKRGRRDTWDLTKMHCFQTGFASRESVFSSASTQIFTVRPKTSITISFVTKDPRTSAVLCSMDGCHLKGKVRYYVTVNLRDYVFVWPGRSVVYCGK
jgi:hypothetical protein